jgi:3-phenylpropionate/trans-cinnamate dioxygenase ferredoxin reductase subunit
VSRFDLVVVGGGPAGHAAAASYREAGGTGSVLVLAQEGQPPYERPPLSKEMLRGEADQDALPLAAHEAWYEEQAIRLRHASAVSLEPGERRVVTSDGETIGFSDCVLATGAAPVRPPVPGAEQAGVHVLRSVEHARALRAAARAGTRALVLGSGFIGCEAAASLRARGCDVVQLSQESAPQVGRLGEEVADRLASWLEELGVQAWYASELESIGDGESRALRAATTGGARFDIDFVLLAGGVRPRTELAADAALALAEGDEVAADVHMRTSAPDVLACGDCCRAGHALAGRTLHIEHWGDALAQGEVAGSTAAGRDAQWDTVPGFWSTIGDRTLKYAAWGDGYDDVRLVEHADGAFTAWYGRDGTCVGVLSHDSDDDYDAGRRRIERGDPVP